MAEKTTMQGKLKRELRGHILLSVLVSIAIIGGLVFWGGFSKISSAVVANGSVVVEGNRKRVQHREGGIVQKIHVKDGDKVEAGAVLIRLDDTLTKANLAIVTKQLAEFRIMASRLESERDGKAGIAFPPVKDIAFAQEELREIELGQERIMESRRKSLAGRESQLHEQIKQLRSQIAGLNVQREAKKREIALLKSDSEALTALKKKKLVTRTKLNALMRELSEAEGELGGFVSEIARVKEAISEKEFSILQLKEDFQGQILEQYQSVKSRIAQLEEQEIAARDKLKHIEIKAPQKGIVHQLAIHTVGAVVPSGETLMTIVPREDKLVVEAQVDPSQIDRLSPNQLARLRFPAFDRRSTPELDAHLEVISADRIVDPKTGLAFYQVRLSISEEELAKLGDQTLIPGMPVEVYLQTGYRTVMSYLVKPLTDQIEHALKER